MLMGIDGIITGVSEFASYFIAGYVIKLIGHMGVLYASLLIFALRFIIYASITNPWLVLIVSVARPEPVSDTR